MGRLPPPAQGTCVHTHMFVLVATSNSIRSINRRTPSSLRGPTTSHPHTYTQALGYTQAAAPPLPMWSPIKEDQLIGYSAHWDTRRGMKVEAPFVRLLATQIGGAGFGNFGFTCHFFFENGTRTADRPMSAAPFGRKGYFLFCPAKDLVTYTKREEPGKDGAVVISYDVDAPASVSTGCKEDKHCEGHWTFQVGGSVG